MREGGRKEFRCGRKGGRERGREKEIEVNGKIGV